MQLEIWQIVLGFFGSLLGGAGFRELIKLVLDQINKRRSALNRAAARSKKEQRDDFLFFQEKYQLHICNLEERLVEKDRRLLEMDKTLSLLRLELEEYKSREMVRKMLEVDSGNYPVN